MSNVPIVGQPQMQTHREGEEIKKNCMNTQCNAPMVFSIPKMEVINARKASMLLFPHEELQTCSECGTAYRFVIAGMQQGRVVYGFVPVQPEEQQQPKIIQPSKKIIIPE